jgi:hypothetical protein
MQYESDVEGDTRIYRIIGTKGAEWAEDTFK